MVNQSKPTVAIFGGSFDPPHKGHQRIVEKAMKDLEIDLLLVVPAYLNPFKRSSLASASKRLEWCHNLFDTVEKVTVDDYEIKQGKSVSTSQSVHYFQSMYDVRYLIIGSDNLSSLHLWHNFEWLNTQITWVIVTRNAHPLDINGLRKWKVLHINALISSTDIRNTKDVDYIDYKIKESVKEILKGNNE
ncbi:MAG: nicotinate (nicotinamide) nucleotide adenylyltransferase [Sulfurovum sp.]|nr:MAG: nicotinate (nicotinamide) nucleotide adenylyltransferase [Sulfurovum sp.]